MTVKDKDETLAERRTRAINDPVERDKLKKESSEERVKVGLDGTTAYVEYLNKDGEVLTDESRGATLAEAAEAAKNELLLAVVGTLPAALSGEVEVKESGGKDADEATVTIKLSRQSWSTRLPARKQGADSK